MLADRRAVWSARLAVPANAYAILAEQEGRMVGFVHVVFDADPRWGSLVDNLHLAHDRRRTGIGTGLLRQGARSVARHAAGSGMYLWVLAQNTGAQQFFRARGAVPRETAIAHEF